MPSQEKKRRPLSSDELKTVQAKLLERKQELWNDVVQDLQADAKNDHQELIDTIRDQGDAGLEELRERTVFSLIEIKHNELRTIEDALRRIESGDYGRCMDCGQWISPARLKAMPHAVRCRRCQAQREKIERA